MAADFETRLDLEKFSDLPLESVGQSVVEGIISSKPQWEDKQNDSDEDGHGTSDKEKLLGSENKSKQSSSWFMFLTLEYYQSFFDVTTSDVIHRILAGLSPVPLNLAQAVESNPDLYGPFWLCMTLLLTTVLSGNLAKFSGGSASWDFHFHEVTVLAIIIYSYTWIVPVLLWLFLVWRKTAERYSLFQLLTIYGYSMATFIPLTIMWIINSYILRWVLLAVAAALSGTVLVKALWRPLKNESRKVAVFTLILLFLLHAAIAVGFKFYYFNSSLTKSGSEQHVDLPSNSTIHLHS